MAETIRKKINKIYVDDVEIPKGNFAFLYDATGDEEFFQKALEMEKDYRLDYEDAMHKGRMVLEKFCQIEIEKKRARENPGTSKRLLLQREMNKIKYGDGSYKLLAEELLKDSGKDYSRAIHIAFQSEISQKEPKRGWLSDMIWDFYACTSKCSHADFSTPPRYRPTEPNCYRVLRTLYYILSIYYEMGSGFVRDRIPVEDWYHLLSEEIDQLKLPHMDREGKPGSNLYMVRETDKGLEFAIQLTDERKKAGTEQKRTKETILSLDKNITDSSNILKATVLKREDDLEYPISVFPSRPMPLTPEFLGSLDGKSRLEIATGISAAIASLHRSRPPIYHRNICPAAFVACQTEKGYKVVLFRLGLIKDMTGQMGETVNGLVAEAAAEEENRDFVAPEALSYDASVTDAWKYADIYSTGKLCLYVLSGGVLPEEGKETELLEETGISEGVCSLLQQMTDLQPEKRPSVRKLQGELEEL